MISVLNCYTGFNNCLQQPDFNFVTEYYSERCIVAALNTNFDLIDIFMMTNIHDELHTLTSIDLIDYTFGNPVTPDILNRYKVPGFPFHKLDLKVGTAFI